MSALEIYRQSPHWGIIFFLFFTLPFVHSDESVSLLGDEASIKCFPGSQSVVHCNLHNIIRNRPRFDIDVLLNLCHEPVDITFYLRSTNFNWNFTYVPNNQNERVYVPRLYLNPPAHMTPTYLYVREPEKEFSTRNGSTDGTRITVEASLVAVHKSMWEEEKFLNYTFILPRFANRICSKWGNRDNSMPSWMLHLILVITILPLAVAIVALLVVKYRKLSGLSGPVDNLDLVRHSDANTPGRESNSQDGSTEHPISVITNNNNIEVKDATKIQSITNLANLSEVTSEGNAFVKSFKKLRNNVQVGIKMPLSFKKLKEEQENSQNHPSFTQVVSDGGTVTTSNPSFMSKSLNSSTVSIGSPSNTTNGSKNNLYFNRQDSSSSFSQVDQFHNIDDAPHGIGFSRPELTQKETSMAGKKPVNHFDYGSRDYLDQLENSPAVVCSNNDGQIERQGRNRKWLHNFNESESEDTENSSANHSKQHQMNSKSEHARKAVQDALQKGYFEYEGQEEMRPSGEKSGINN